MSSQIFITSSIGAWELGAWEVLGETPSLSEEELTPSLTEEGFMETLATVSGRRKSYKL